MNRLKQEKIIVGLLTLPLICGLVVSIGAIKPTLDETVGVAAAVGSFIAAPKNAVAAMGKTYSSQVEETVKDNPAGEFVTQEPKNPEKPPESTPKPEIPSVAPEGALGVIKTTYSAEEDRINIPYGAGLIKNVTDLPREEVAQALTAAMPFTIERNSDAPQILVMHTHATEGYQPSEAEWYLPSDPTRTVDNSNNVTSVGQVLVDVLNDNGINTLHDRTQHDYPSYNGGYDRSQVTVENYLATYPSIKIVLDIHRDAIEKEDGTRVRPVAEINGKTAAQVMIISGADNGSMGMPNYKQNLRFAGGLQDSIQTLYPTLSRPVLFDYRNYNQQLTTGSLLIEVGGHANTLEEAKYSAELVGLALSAIM